MTEDHDKAYIWLFLKPNKYHILSNSIQYPFLNLPNSIIGQSTLWFYWLQNNLQKGYYDTYWSI